MTRKRLVLTAVAACIASVLLTLWLGPQDPQSPQDRGPHAGARWQSLSVPLAGSSPVWPEAPSRTYRLRCHVRYRNTGAWPATARVDVPIPSSQPPFARIDEVTTTPAPSDQRDDMWGNRVATVELPAVPSGGTARLEMTARVRVFQVVKDIDARDLSADVAAGPDLQPYLRAASGIPSDDAGLRKSVAAIVAAESNPWYRLVDLYDYTRAMTFRLTDESQDVREALKRGIVQCSDAAALFTTLARAARVPARYVAGVWVDEEKTVAHDTHAWSVTWLDATLGWVPLDPTMARFDDMTRQSRLAEQTLGYLPLWQGTPRAFRVQVKGAPVDAASTSSPQLKVEFEYRLEASEDAPSLLLRFPLPSAAGASKVGASTRVDAAAWSVWRRRIDAAIGDTEVARRLKRFAALREAAASGGGAPWLVDSVQGVCDARSGHLTRAESELQRAVSTHATPLTCVNLAQFYLWTKQLSRALQAYSDALRLDARSLDTWRAIIVTYASLEIWDGVAQAAAHAQALFPQLAEFPSEAGQAWMHLRQYARACGAFRAALRIVPNNGWMHAMLGWMLRESGDTDGARRELARGLSLGVGGSERAFFERMLTELRRP